jgi:hypothetical protein
MPRTASALIGILMTMQGGSSIGASMSTATSVEVS